MVKFFIRNKPFVRIISLVLIMALCISGLSFLTPPAEALAITASVTAIIITFFALCGITFASADLAKKAADEFIQKEVQTDTGFWADIQAAADRVDNGNIDPNDPYDPGNLSINAMTGAAVAKLINKIKSWFGNIPNDGNISVPIDSALMFQGVKVYTDFDFTRLFSPTGIETTASVYSNCPYSLTDVVSLRSPVTGDLKTYSVGISSETISGNILVSGDMYCNGVRITNRSGRLLSIEPYRPNMRNPENITVDLRYGFYFSDYYQTINMYQIGKILNTDTGVISYQKSYLDAAHSELKFSNSDNYATKVYDYDFVSLSEPATEKLVYKNKTVYSINSIYNALSSQIKSGNSVVIDISDTITEIEETTTENLTVNQEQLLIETDILTALEELVAGQPDDPFEGVPKPSPMPTIGNIWDIVTDFLANALIWMQLWVSGFNELPQSLQDTLWAILVVVIVIGILGVIL